MLEPPFAVGNAPTVTGFAEMLDGVSRTAGSVGHEALSSEKMSVVSPAAAPRLRDASQVTVGAALRLPVLRSGAPEVVAGRENLHRPIRWVHVAEVANIASLLKGGELLLSTGICLGRRAAEQRRFADELADREVAGLVVELGTAVEALPPALVQRARARGLPLVALHHQVRFVEITEAIHETIVNRQLAVLRRGDEIHRRFTELMVEGAGIPEVLAVLSTTIANPVLLEKGREDVLYHVPYRTSGDEALAAWEALRHELDHDPEAAGDAIVLPVPATGGTIWGRLVALPLDSPMDEFDRVAMERAVALVALALLRQRQEELLAARERGNFLADLAAGRLEPLAAARRAAALGFEPRAGMVLPLALVPAPGAGGDDSDRGEAAWAPVWRALRDDLRSRAVPVLVGSRSVHGDVLIIVAVAGTEAREAVIEQVVATIREAMARHLGSPDAAIVAAGAAVTGFDALAAALREAADAAHAAVDAPRRPWHDATAPDLERLLWKLRSDADVRTFVRRRLGPILDHDARRRSPLLPTLEAYVEHGGRKAEAARALHLERQSLYSRLGRIEAMLGVRLDDPDTRLGLHLAVRALRHLDGPPV